MVWESEAYTDFTLQSATETGDTNWQDASGLFNSPNGLFSVSATPDGGTSRVFRLVEP